MEVRNITDTYNEQRNRHCKTLEDIVKDSVEDILQAIVNDVDELIDDVKSGKYSNEEVAERLEEIRERIIWEKKNVISKWSKKKNSK